MIVKKTAVGVFLTGLLILVILSILGTVYLTKMAFDSTPDSSGMYPGNLNQTERNIARLAIVFLWIQFTWIVLGTIYQVY